MLLFSDVSPSHLLHHYGEPALFVLLALGILGLPIPDETLLVLAGYLAAHEHMNPVAMFIAALAGSMVGISLSYGLGLLLEHSILLRYGKYIGVTPPRLKKAHVWFDQYGKWCLLFGYFIPGFRHVTGLFSGISYLRFREFALFAYTGALLWVSTFLTLGYFFYEAVQKLMP